MENNPVVQTSVQTIDADLNEIFNFGQIPSATSTSSAAPNNGIFRQEGQADMSFLNTPSEPEKKEEDKPEGTETNTETPTETIDEVLNLNGNGQGESEENTEGGEPNKGGRPKTDKSGVLELFKREIEAGRMVTFDDYDESKQTLDEYLGGLSQKDLDELWTANQTYNQTQLREQISQEFFESLPQELQLAYQYAANGGTDMKALFSALAQVEQVRELDATKPEDQEIIARQYLQATGFGDDNEIEEEIKTWKDLNVLDKKASQFKPKLDKIQEQKVQAQLARQEQLRKQEEAAAQAYVENTYNALAAGEINGLKLDRKTQNFLYQAITGFQYPSMTGRATNLLGHLLEKYQYQEPNYALIAEATWLLSDPEAYRTHVAQQLGANKEVEQTVRKLKTEEGRKQGSSTQPVDKPAQRRNVIQRPANIFQRRG